MFSTRLTADCNGSGHRDWLRYPGKRSTWLSGKEANALLDRNALLEKKTTVERRLNMLAINGCLALLTEVIPILRKMLALVDEAVGGCESAPTDSSQPRSGDRS